VGTHPFTTNSEFHNILAKASKNPILVIVEATMMTVVTDFLNRLTPDFNGSKRAIREHEGILDAIKKRDPEEAAALLEKHILRVGSRFRGFRTNP
jgi:DNA-binding GntR family transcriptional regulator